jgi:hypothetical protein
MGFFKKDDIQEKDVQSVHEVKAETKEVEKSVFRKKNLSLFDVDTIEYVIENFPTMSIEIQNGLNNLADILENTIDYIEDKSSEIIKKNRDFKLSQDHRDTAIAIYGVVENLGEYVKWMQHEYEKNIENKEAKINQSNQKIEDEIQENYVEEVNEDLINKIVDKEVIEIYKDFSLKEPKAFKLDNNIVMVEDWDDLLVKTAEVLTKQYRENKNSNKSVQEIKAIEKKSSQNSFRDTVIEMLNEYKISLDEFKIIIK